MELSGTELNNTVRSTGLLSGRTLLVTGVLRPSSIASAVTTLALEQGAQVVLTAHPRTERLTRATARDLGRALDTDLVVLPLDVADTVSLSHLEEHLRAHGVTRLDGVLHAVAHADSSLLGSSLLAGPGSGADPEDGSHSDGHSGLHNGLHSDDRAQVRAEALRQAFTVCSASLAGLTQAVRPLLGRGSSVLTLTFESERVTAGYGWMAPLKAALEASVRVLAVDLGPEGVRVNALSCGPLRTMAAGSVPGIETLAERWGSIAPLGWDPDDAQGVARTAVALLSDWLPATTGQVVRADGGACLPGV